MGYPYQVNLIFHPDGSLEEASLKALNAALDDSTLSVWQKNSIGIIAFAATEIVYKTTRRTILSKAPDLAWDSVRDKPVSISGSDERGSVDE